MKPLVSCLMVTCNRAQLAHRAVACLAAQTWENKELVIVDDGAEDYEPVLAPFRDRLPIHYHRIEKEEGRYLGGLRNLSLELAKGEFCMQWDDDEWYHPDRIARQMQVVEQGYDAVVLKQTLMHLNTAEWVEHPYRAELRKGTPGTIVHRASKVRYPNTPHSEDTVYLQDLREEMKVGLVEGPHSHLFIRCFHGSNTWDQQHFLDRLKRTLKNKVAYVAASYVRRDILTHPAFKLNDVEREAVATFLKESRALGLVS